MHMGKNPYKLGNSHFLSCTQVIAFNKMSVPLRSAKLTVWQAQTGNFAKL
jgi:hypothetical protein